MPPKVNPQDARLIRIEDIDRGVKSWFDRVLDLHVQTPQGDRRKVAVRFTAGERWVASADRQGIRDKDGRLILPVIQVRRTSIDPMDNKTALGANVPTLQVARLIDNKSSALANLDLTRPISERRLEGGAVYDIYTIPFPSTTNLKYRVSFQAQSQMHVNEFTEKLLSKLEFYDIPSFIISLTGDDRERGIPTGKGSTELEPTDHAEYAQRLPLSTYYVVGYIEGDFADGGNLEDFTDQERILQMSVEFHVPAALVLNPEGERGYVQHTTAAFEFTSLDETVVIVDHPSEADRIFGRRR